MKKDYEMCGVRFGSVHSVKDLGVLIASNLKYILQGDLSVRKAKMMMGFLKRFLFI